MINWPLNTPIDTVKDRSLKGIIRYIYSDGTMIGDVTTIKRGMTVLSWDAKGETTDISLRHLSLVPPVVQDAIGYAIWHVDGSFIELRMTTDGLGLDEIAVAFKIPRPPVERR